MKQSTLIAGKYRLVAKLGFGAAGSVWSAINELTERKVALKLLHPIQGVSSDHRERLLREARACGRIHHKNVVEVYDVGTTDNDAPFLVMQILSGETLEQKLRREGILDVRTTGAIIAQCAAGLAAVHEANIVHRDFKPANVFLHRDGTGPEIVKLLDFGVSKILVSSETSNTATGNPLGSPGYMAPEQARGEKSVDGRADLWALGVVTFEMVAARLPFRGGTVYETIAAILNGEIPRLADVTPGVDVRLDELVTRCIVRDPKLRLASAREALAILASFVDVPTRADRPLAIPQRGQAPATRASRPELSGPYLAAIAAHPETAHEVEPATTKWQPFVNDSQTVRMAPAGLGFGQPASGSGSDEDATLAYMGRGTGSNERAEVTKPSAVRTAAAAMVARARRRRRLVRYVAIAAASAVIGAVIVFALASPDSNPPASPAPAATP